MINKIVHFSDLHIKTYKSHDLYRQILVDVVNQWKELNPDRIVFTGDLLDTKNQISPEQIDLMYRFLSECARICKTVLILGNHDFLENNLDRMDAISVSLEMLDNENIVFYKNRGCYADNNVNWCVYSLLDNNLPPDIKHNGNHNIGLFHGQIQKLKTDKGFNFQDGFDVSKFNGLDVVLCGDIHKRQEFTIPNNKKGYMIGSLIQQKHDETITNHGYGIYHVNTGQYEYVDVFNPTPFLTFSISSIDDIEEGNEFLLNY